MNKFNLGDMVYFLTDLDNTPYMIVSYTTTLDGGDYYTISHNGVSCNVYGLEISKNKNIE